MAASGDARPWVPPPWLRNLGLVAREHAAEPPAPASPAARLARAFELMSFALARLGEQAARRGCTTAELLRLYEQAEARFRARG
jgi:hypothetical protein